jgi:FkbM family methyltransferase
MPMISFAQNGEDVLLNRLFPADYRGTYVDVGANHPTLHSVTRHFYDRGWRGINVEPVSRVYEMLVAERPEDLNLSLALSDHQGSMTLHESVDALGMSTLDPDFAAGLLDHGFPCVERAVPVTTLAALCERHVGDRTVDFLKIDVEGHEAAVIRGGDWGRWRPRVVLVEATIAPETWEALLLTAGYLPAAFDGLNRYYVRGEDEAWLPLLRAPVNVLDDFVLHDHVTAIEDLRYQRDEARIRLAELDHRLAEQRRAIEELRLQRDDAEARLGDLGPGALAAARRLRSISRRVPLAGRLARRFLLRAG